MAVIVKPSEAPRDGNHISFENSIDGRLRVLYIGPDSGTCRARYLALQRLGYDVLQIDPFAALPQIKWARSWSFQSGGLGLTDLVRRHIASKIQHQSFNLAYVDSGELIGPSAVRMLRKHAAVVVNYNPDNPYSARDGWRWRAFKAAIPYYDQLFVPRLSNVAEALAAGARSVERVWFAADDALKQVDGLPQESAKKPFRSAVSFVGTWMPERGPIMAYLLEKGLPARIFGPRWNRAPEFPRLAPFTTVGELDGSAYDAAVAAADISIALLSKGNRDLHTTRSMEIPSLGSLLCGERTDEHLALYEDGTEAIFWSDPDECVLHCRQLLDNPGLRLTIAAAGHRRALANNHFNEPLMQRMIFAALGLGDRSIQGIGMS